VEVLVSMFLISVGLMAVVSLFSSNLVRVINSRNQTIAGLLAQEGAELVRNIRDNNVAAGLGSFDVNLPSESKTDCIIDMGNVVMNDDRCDRSLIQEKLYYSPLSSKNYYIHSSAGGKETKFKRKIDIAYSGTGDARAMTVTSIVAWGETFPSVSDCNFANRCAYVETTLTKWKEN